MQNIARILRRDLCKDVTAEVALHKFTTEEENRFVRIGPRDIPHGLEGTKYLDDQIMHSYIQLMISELGRVRNGQAEFGMWTTWTLNESHTDSNKFLNITKDNFYGYRKIFVPVHIELHWFLLVIEPPSRCIRVYDSLKRNGINKAVYGRVLETKAVLQKLLDADTGDWGIKILGPDQCYQQSNAYDCGVLTLLTMRGLAMDLKSFSVDHSPQDMETLGQRMRDLIALELAADTISPTLAELPLEVVNKYFDRPGMPSNVPYHRAR